MDTWQRILKHSLKTPEEIAARFDLDVEQVKKVSQNFKAQITPYYADLIKCKNDPLYKQVVPDTNELKENGGVNDDSLVMKRLVHKLLKVRVKPYYIYQADLVKGTELLSTTVEKGLEIMDAIRGWTSGLAVPCYVIDAPGGGGKIPLLPEYLQSFDQKKVVMRNYSRKTFVYPQISLPIRKKMDMRLFGNVHSLP